MTTQVIREMLQARSERSDLAEAGDKLAALLKRAADHHFRKGCQGCEFPLFEAELTLMLWEQLRDDQAKVKVRLEEEWIGVKV